MMTDLAFAVRSLLARKASSAGAVLILAMAIGSNTAIFGVTHALVLQPLPVREADRLVVPQGLQKDTGFNGSLRDLQAWRHAQSFEAVAGAEARQANLTGDGDAERVNAAAVESTYVSVFGINPFMGRFFSAEETAGTETTSVVLGYALWQRRFGADASILGRAVMIDGRSHAVVGVLPPAFDMPQQTDVWLPSAPDNLPFARHGAHVLPTVARLRPGVSREEASAELQAIARRLEREFPDSHSGWGARVLDLRSAVFADPERRIGRGLRLLFVGGALLLLIACANFGNLLLAGTIARSQEVGTRLALGAGRVSIARQFVLEGVLLALGSAALSFPASLAAINVLLSHSPVHTNAFSHTLFAATVSWPLILFTVALVGVTGILAGAIPAVRVSRLDVVQLISGAGRSSDTRGTQRVFEIAIVGQIALTLVLLLASSLLVESFVKLQQLDLGFRPQGVVALDMTLARTYPVHPQRAAFIERLLEGARALPGVESAGVTTNTPLTTLGWASRYECEGRPFDPSEVLMTSDRLVTTGYLETLGVRLVKGRFLTGEDRADSIKVAVIDEELAARCWPGQDPVGRRIRRISQALSMDWITIVGLVQDVRENRQNFRGNEPVWYLPYSQWNSVRDLRLAIRTRGEASIAGPMRDLLHRLDPTLPMSPPATVERDVSEVLAMDRFSATILAYFSSVSTLLVGLGVYSALAGYVARQRRAIATRLAIGAKPSHILGFLAKRVVILMLAGTGIGVMLCLPLSRVMASLVFGVDASDWVRVLTVATGLIVLSAIVSVVPARRAVRINPIEVLRSR